MVFITIQGNDWLVLRNIGYYISNNYMEVADLCNALMLSDKAEGNY